MTQVGLDGRRLATAGALRIDQYHLENDELIAFASRLVRRRLTDEECSVYLRARRCPSTPFAPEVRDAPAEGDAP